MTRWIAVIALAWCAMASGSEEPDWAERETDYQYLKFTAYRTDPATWSKEGGFGLRWGMGPGDVRAVYPAQDMVRTDIRAPSGYQSGVFADTIEGAEVLVSAVYYRGKLFAVKIGARYDIASIKESPAERVARYRRQKAWRDRVRPVVLHNQGKPLSKPSAAVLERDRSQAEPIADEYYVWARNGTTIKLGLDPQELLHYYDKARYSKFLAAQAEAAAEREKAQSETESQQRKRL